MGKKLIILGKAGKVSHPKFINSYDGVSDHDDFSNYYDESGLESGYMRLKVIDNVLYTVVDYVVEDDFSDEQIPNLIDYTSGQLSDGIGEGFEQMPCTYITGEEAYASPWFMEQELVHGATVEEALEKLNSNSKSN